MQHFRFRALAATLPFLLSASPPGFAQLPTPPSRAEATAALNPAPVAFTPQQLDQMLAPIALYPDKLLTALLMAATFPLQVVEAGKWLQDPNNAALKGDDLAAALQPLPWDPSVKSLVPLPQVVALMNDHLDWTESLGIAFANQQIETMARIQFLRQRAVAAGGLKSTPHLVVSGGPSDIVIEPVDPAMVYLPVYNPAIAYGEWPDDDYPPVYIPPPPDYRDAEIGAGIGVAVGFGVVGGLWGWGHPDWHRHEVVVDPARYRSITNTTNITNNNIVIQNNTWHRTAAVARVPDSTRPHRESADLPHPQGTVTPAAIVPPSLKGGERTDPAPGTRPAPPGTANAPAHHEGPPMEPRGPAPFAAPASPQHQEGPPPVLRGPAPSEAHAPPPRHEGPPPEPQGPASAAAPTPPPHHEGPPPMLRGPAPSEAHAPPPHHEGPPPGPHGLAPSAAPTPPPHHEGPPPVLRGPAPSEAHAPPPHHEGPPAVPHGPAPAAAPAPPHHEGPPPPQGAAQHQGRDPGKKSPAKPGEEDKEHH